jgi:predicted enzyme related to lactoylglutathione lyase
MIASVKDTPIGGLLEKSASTLPTGKAQWLGYIGVDDVRVFSQRVQQAGGVVHRSAEEIPNVGIFAVAADPQGAIFVLFSPLDKMMTQPVQPDLNTPGMPVWHELRAANWEAAFQFYAGLFGWTKAHAVNMGPDSIYQLFAAGEQPIGGMMTVPNFAQGTGWLFYFYVKEIEAGVNRVNKHGGTVLHGPSAVPGGQQVALCLDPQGAAFGIVGPGRK